MQIRKVTHLQTLALRALNISLIGIGLAALPAWAGSTVVSANPHRLTCGATTPPQVNIANYSGVKTNAYHVDVTSNCDFTTALGFPTYSKPKIISDDILTATAAQANPRIDQVAAAGEHYEHYAGQMDIRLVDGNTIGGSTDFDAESLSILNKLGSYASWLPSNGTLTQSGTEFFWNGQQITLMGFSLNPILATKNVNLTQYLDVLASKGVNFLRVDAVSQWAALTVTAGQPDQLDPTNGLNPYAINTPGSPGQTLTTKWDLTQFNQEYFNRAKDLVALAAERGIVVQFSLFDRHGLLNESNPPGSLVEYGRFLGSPYNQANNVNGLLAAGPAHKAPSDFTGMDLTTIGGITKAYMQKVVKEIGGYGNVMFEIMNEPLESANDWTNTVAWHQWVADTMNTELAKSLITMPMPKAQTAVAGSTASFTVMVSNVASPAYQWQMLSGGVYTNLTDGGRIQGSQTATLRIGSIVAGDATSYRCIVSGGTSTVNSGPATLAVTAGGLVVKDGFTAADGTLVNGRTTEAGAKVWSADDVKISGQKARSNNEAGKFRILGSVPVSLAGLQTASVQAELLQSATGVASIGFRPSALGAFDATDNSLWLDMTRAGSLTLKKRVSGTVTTLKTLDLTTLGFAIGNTVHLRLVYKVATGKVDVYVNHVKRMNDVTLSGSTPSTAFAGLQAQRGSTADTYLDTGGEIDNFEVVLSP